MPLSQDWRFRNECFPFQDESNYYITVESEYETPGDQKESRLNEARRSGVFKLLKFYGKSTPQGQFSDLDLNLQSLYNLSNVEDYYVSYRPCVRMKVLVSIPKSDFDSVPDDPTACEINKPAEGYLSAFISVSSGVSMIEQVAEGMSSLVPALVRSDKYISNVDVVREIQRLRLAARVIQRYLELNDVSPTDITDPECIHPTEVDRELEIGFSFDYKAAFALVEQEQHTIGYDCLLENSVLNRNTTVNYLLNLRDMLQDLNSKDSPSFNVFDFLTKYTIPTPVILQKDSNMDGLSKYDENGNLFSFANLAKLITLDLDVNLCKTDEEKRREDSIVADPALKADIARASKQTKDFIGNNKTSAEGVQRLRERIENAVERGEQDAAIKVLYEDVMAKVNLGCVLEDTIKCLLENMVTSFGDAVFDDPDLEEVINIQNVSLGGFNNGCKLDRCDGSPDLNLKVGFPAFQGINIPENFPTLDFLAKTIDQALVSLYNTIVSSLSSLILGILEGLCDLIFSLPDGIARIGEGFKSWLSQTLGIDLALLDDPSAWKSALLSSTGGGFLGTIGRAASSIEGAILDSYTQTGIALNLPNPKTGEIEEVFISPEFLGTFFGELNEGVTDMEAVLTPFEIQTIYKGSPRPEVLELAYRCVTRNGSTIFDSPEVFQDIMSGIGDVLNPQFLTQNISDEPTVASNVCDLVDDLSIRKSILREKDATLSKQEVDEIINKEKERKKSALLEKVDALNSYQAGSFAPAFPNIFGDGGLIPETPPVIDDIVRLVAELSMQSVVSNFSIDSLNYSGFWDALSDDDPFNIYNNSLISEQNNVYNIGYSLTSQPQNTVKEEVFLPVLTTGLETDASGQPSEIFIFTFGKNYFSSRQEAVVFETNLQLAYPGTFGVTDEHKLLFEDISVFVEDNDTGFGDTPVTERFEDPLDPAIFYIATVRESDGQVYVAKRQGLVQESDVIRESGFENDIIKLSLASEPGKIVIQKSDDFTIGNTAASLGTKFTTGRLRTDVITAGIGDFELEIPDVILSPEAQAFGEDLDFITLNETLINQFIAYIPEQADTDTELNLTYPESDILAYSQLSQFSKEFSSRILSVTLSGEVCDTLSVLRRTNATAALRMLVRNFIVEQALISIQVFNSFDTSFMENDLFISSVYRALVTEVFEYQSSFDTLESSLLSELKEVALKYYELLKALGEDDREPLSGKLAIKEVISDEVRILKQPIINALGLQFNNNTWDDFLIDNIFGEISDVTQTLQKDTISSVAPEEPGFVFLRSRVENKPATTYSYDLLIATATEEEQPDSVTVTDSASDYTVRSTESNSVTVETETVISIQCEQENTSEADEDEIYSNLRAMMIESENYQKLFYDLVPVDSLVATLSLYQYSALSDPAVYPNNDDLYDLMGKTKLSTLQIFAAAIYGGGKISYQDPFLEKAGTDQVF